MARRRMISQELIHDEDLNFVSIEAQNIFFRCLTISDDCGVIPGNEYQLKSMLNLSSKISNKLQEYLKELVLKRLLIRFPYQDKIYYAFKQSSFENYQAYIIKNRTKSEYLKMKVSDFQQLKLTLQEFTVNYSNYLDNGCYHIESKEYKVESKEYKDKEQISKKIPPVENDVIEYFKTKGIDNGQAEKFFNYYESNGWKVGKNKMVNWHSAVVNWIKNIKEYQKEIKSTRRNNLQEIQPKQTY